MNILLIGDSYLPEIRSISLMMKEFAEDLVARGHDVTVATFWPQYNLTEDTKKLQFNEFSRENGVCVIRVRTLPHHKINFIIRGIAELTAPLFFWKKIKKYLKRKVDVVIVYISPLSLAWVGHKIKKKYDAKFLLNIQDIFPQNAIDLGIMKNSWLIHFFEYLERKAYASADWLTSHTESSRIFLIEKKGVAQEKVRLVHNWIDVNNYINIQRTNKFRKKYGIEDKFIFLFAGVIGPAQGLDLFIKAAVSLKEINEISFLFVGDGSEKGSLLKMVADYELKNVLFHDFVAMDDYPFLVKDADVGLVCLSAMNKTPVIPGKVLSYMAASIPVLAVLNTESDGHKLISRAKCGYSIAADAPQEDINNLILKTYHNRKEFSNWGINGCQYVLNNFAKKHCIDNMVDLFVQGCQCTDACYETFSNEEK